MEHCLLHKITDTSLTNDGLQFADGVSLFILDDTGVVFSESTQEIYQLNTTATYIWCRLEDCGDLNDATQGLAETFGFSLDDSKRYIEEMLADWTARGFFARRTLQEHHDIQRSSHSNPPPIPPSSVPDSVSEGPLPYQRCYRILDQTFRVGYGSRLLESWVHPPLSHLELPLDQTDMSAIQFNVTKDRQGIFIIVTKSETFRCGHIEEVAPIVSFLVFSQSVKGIDWSIGIHAGAVSDGERALLLPAESGAGKTSLTAALVSAGYHYHSDDLVLFDSSSARFTGLPIGLCIKQNGTDLISAYFPDFARLHLHKRPDGKWVRYISPPPDSFANGPFFEPRRSWIVFPKYLEGVETRMFPIRRPEALQRLINHCIFSPPVKLSQVRILIHWLKNSECYELPQSSLEKAVEQLQELWAQ